MAVNLVRNYTREQAHHLLNSSFAQFLADRGVVQLERQLEHDRAFLDGYREQMRCDLGDFDGVLGAARARRASCGRRTGGARSAAASDGVREAVAALRPGEVDLPAAGATPRPGHGGRRTATGRPRCSPRTASSSALSAKDFDEPPRRAHAGRAAARRAARGARGTGATWPRSS